MKEKIIELLKQYEDKHTHGVYRCDYDELADEVVKLFCQPDVIGSPIQLESVLAEIEHINDLGKSKWYEVVYFDENWQSYVGSKTFQDGEKVIRWKYAKDCL